MPIELHPIDPVGQAFPAVKSEAETRTEIQAIVGYGMIVTSRKRASRGSRMPNGG